MWITLTPDNSHLGKFSTENLPLKDYCAKKTEAKKVLKPKNSP